MRHPVQIYKILGLLLLLLLFFMSATMTVQAAAQTTLIRMEKQEQVGSTRITLHFSALPDFEIEHNGQRVDLLLKSTGVSAQLRSLPEDETVVKILLAQKYRDLLTSILFRRPPSQVITESKSSPPRVVMDLYWEGESGARPGVAFRIADMPPRKPGKKAQALQKESPWQGRWPDFFREYQTYWTLNLPLNYTLPPLPPLVTNRESPLWPLQQHAETGMWLSLLRKASRIVGLDEQQIYLRNLLVAEAHLRTGAVEAALARLQSLPNQQGKEQIRVDYLTTYGLAAGGQPFVAQIGLLELLPMLPVGETVTPLVYLLAAEIALATKQPKPALDDLQNEELIWPEQLIPVIELRIADALAGLGRLGEAVAEYRSLAEEAGLFNAYPSSCNLAAFSAYRHGDFDLANRLYRKLSGLMKEQPGDDLVLFAVGVAAYDAGDLSWGMIGLQKTTLERPGTEGGERAELRLIDHTLNTGGELELARAASEYDEIGKRAGTCMVREEATFKRALALYLLKDHRESVRELMRFRREFGSSKLRRETDLLLAEQLPIVVHNLLEERDELPAVVLVEQNRNLLLRGDLDRAFLHDLASAFDKLGLYERSGRILLYLFDRTRDESRRAPFYLPLARSFLKRAEFVKASDYADRYLQKHLDGEDRGALFGVLLDAFEKQQRNEELLSWLGRKNRPSSPQLEIRAAWIYWRLGKSPEVVSSLERARQDGGELQVKEMALLAESYYRLKKNRSAEKIYRQLSSDPAFASQARYRRAQILLRQKQRQAALNLLRRLVEEDADSSWGKLAQDLLFQEKQ